MEAKVANMRYKPFAGLPPQASEKVTFNCMGKVKEIHQRYGQHRRIEERILIPITLSPIFNFIKTENGWRLITAHSANRWRQ